MHLVQSDEIYHFYAGSPLELLLLLPDGTFRVEIIGNDFAAGQQPQFVIHRGWWQGSRVKPGGDYALIGATVAPGFDFADFAIGKRSELTQKWPGARELITALTRE
jgi:predicted cupin superfamily sugar epimerase